MQEIFIYYLKKLTQEFRTILAMYFKFNHIIDIKSKSFANGSLSLFGLVESRKAGELGKVGIERLAIVWIRSKYIWLGKPHH